MPVCCTFRRVQLFTLIFAAAIIIAILMILFSFSYPTFAKQRIIEAVVFKNGTEAIERFRTTVDIKDLRLSFYLYNVTNAQEITSSTSAVKFNLSEIGPFVYSELKYKEFLDNNQTSGQIKFKLRRRFKLDETLSVADPKKILITWPNVPLLVADAYINKMGPLERRVVKTFLNKFIAYEKNETAFITDTVENFIFEGSKRVFFEKLQNISFGLIKPWPLKDNKFALLYGKNDHWDPTTDYVYTVSTGFGLNETYENLNKYVYVNGSKSLKFWRNQPPQCNSFGGTDGQFFSPFLNQQENLEVYAIDLCRKLSFKFRGQVSIRGLGAFKYTLDERSVQSGLKNPENQCYCIERGDNDVPKPECNLDGLMDLSSCANPNVVATGAHFINSSPELINRVIGLSPPNASLHEPTLYVEPNTGLTVKINVPMQFNIRLEKGGLSVFNFFKDNETLILPLLWTTETSELTDSQARMMRSSLILLDSWLISMVLGGAIVLILAIAVAVTIVCIKFRDSRVIDPNEIEPLINPAAMADSTATQTNSRATDHVQPINQEVNHATG